MNPNMKKLDIILFLLIVLLWTGCHKDEDMSLNSPVITNEEMSISDTEVSVSWNVQFSGKFHTGMEISDKEDMTDARRVEATIREGKYLAVADDLTAGTKYYCRVVVWNKYGGYYDEVKGFETHKTYSIQASCNPPEGGTISGMGQFEEGQYCTLKAVSNHGFYFVNWSEDGEHVSANDMYSFLVTDNRLLVANFALQRYTISVSADPTEGGSVSGGGNYYFGYSCTVSATAAEGYTFVNWTENGNVVSTDASYTFIVDGNHSLKAYFIIQIPSPTVETNMVTSVTQTTAIGGGNVISSGGASVIERGICWSVEPQPTISDHHFYSGTGTGIYSVPMSNLIPGTTYYVRAYAINSGGVGYGDEVSFTTLSE